MRQRFEEVIVDDGNRRAIDAVLDLAEGLDGPKKLFVYGPKNSGKTTFTLALGKHYSKAKDALICTTAAEMLLSIQLGDVSSDYLTKIAETRCLVVDGFEDFSNDPSVGSELFRLLVQERDAHGFSTVVFSNREYGSSGINDFSTTLKGFERITIDPLDSCGLADLAMGIQNLNREQDSSAPILNDDAIRYIARRFASKPNEIHAAMQFVFIEGRSLGKGVLSADDVAEMFAM